MTDDTEFISVRLPADVANWLRQYATDNNLIRAGKPNMGGSIISAIRDRINGITDSQTISNNVRQSDIEAIVNNAIAPLLARLEALENTHGEAKALANFTQALLQRAKEVAPLKLKEVA